MAWKTVHEGNDRVFHFHKDYAIVSLEKFVYDSMSNFHKDYAIVSSGK